ncbi:MAG TPA: hypothetical protein VG734_14600 [Lacunisphaera sp.]|nr:hypothetical protein [Lacunisphaera sp.]
MKDVLPAFAAELRELLDKAERPDLAAKVERLELVERCRCDDEFCSSFYTAPRPNGAYGAGHSNLSLAPKEGMVILDLVHDEIRYVEVIDRPDVRKALFASVP